MRVRQSQFCAPRPPYPCLEVLLTQSSPVHSQDQAHPSQTQTDKTHLRERATPCSRYRISRVVRRRERSRRIMQRIYRTQVAPHVSWQRWLILRRVHLPIEDLRWH